MIISEQHVFFHVGKQRPYFVVPQALTMLGLVSGYTLRTIVDNFVRHKVVRYEAVISLELATKCGCSLVGH